MKQSFVGRPCCFTSIVMSGDLLYDARKGSLRAAAANNLTLRTSGSEAEGVTRPPPQHSELCEF